MSATEALLRIDDPTPANLDAWAPVARGLIEDRLTELLPSARTGPKLLGSAVRDACLGRGKRVRPLLALLSAQQFGGDWPLALDFGCAVEMVHSASLILDDLPCMDDAALRRGRPTLHRTYGEATAVLGAVALLNEAYAVVAADDGLSAEARLALQQLLTQAIGFQGLTAGQTRDLHDAEATRTEANLTTLNHEKTGVLFVAVVEGGAVLAGASEAERASARRFAGKLGMAFQLLDDLHDATASIQVLGKDAGKDAGRTTFASLWGVERARQTLKEIFEEALADLGDREGALAQYALSLFRHAGYSHPA